MLKDPQKMADELDKEIKAVKKGLGDKDSKILKKYWEGCLWGLERAQQIFLDNVKLPY